MWAEEVHSDRVSKPLFSLFWRLGAIQFDEGQENDLTTINFTLFTTTAYVKLTFYSFTMVSVSNGIK
jgi:hypothetical protein